MKKRKSFKAALSLAVVVAMLCALSVSAFAADTSIDTSRTGSITVELPGETDGKLSLYKVASTVLIGNDMVYNFTSAFAECDLSLDDLEDSELVASLCAYVEENNIQSEDALPIEDGIVEFTDLKLGVYLIVQTESSTGYTNINPFLFTIPYLVDDEWVYDIDDATPKMEPGTSTQPSPTPTTPSPSITPGGSVTPTPPDKPETSPGSSEEPGDSPKPSDEQGGETEPSPNPGDEPGDSEGTESDDESETSPSSSTSGEPIPPTGTSGSSGSSGGGSQETLPQTGQLNWPIPVLAGVGLVLIIVGGVILIVSRKQKKTE